MSATKFNPRTDARLDGVLVRGYWYAGEADTRYTPGHPPSWEAMPRNCIVEDLDEFVAALVELGRTPSWTGTPTRAELLDALDGWLWDRSDELDEQVWQHRDQGDDDV